MPRNTNCRKPGSSTPVPSEVRQSADLQLPLGKLKVTVDHDLDELLAKNLGFPAKLTTCLGRIADQQLDFRRTFVPVVVLDVLLPIEVQSTERLLAEIADAMGFVGGDHIIVGLI